MPVPRRDKFGDGLLLRMKRGIHFICRLSRPGSTSCLRFDAVPAPLQGRESQSGPHILDKRCCSLHEERLACKTPIRGRDIGWIIVSVGRPVRTDGAPQVQCDGRSSRTRA
jgi:hypothetical protein